MTFLELKSAAGIKKPAILFILCVFLAVLAGFVSYLTQTSFGQVDVEIVSIQTAEGKQLSGKLFIPGGIGADNPAPGIVYLHGYQNNRETSIPYCLEAARRGIVALAVDTLGRGKSDFQLREDEPGFDPLYGAAAAWEYLLSLEFVDPERSGLMGHSLGAEMAYNLALQDNRERALVFSGFGYRDDASAENPRNMLMIFGKYDEYRGRMTNTRDFEAEWMNSPLSAQVFGRTDPLLNTTYGDFKSGTARKVYMTETTHVRESFDKGAVAEACLWLKGALVPDEEFWIDAERQIWRIKEVMNLLAMIFTVMSLLPLSLVIFRSGMEKKLRKDGAAACPVQTVKDIVKPGLINALVMLLYLPLILVLFGFHVYVLQIDRVLPLMMVNGVLFWFLATNLIGFFLQKSWNRKHAVVYDRFSFADAAVGVILFLTAYVLQHLMEIIFKSDFRYIFPYASAFTPFRVLLFAEYGVLFFFGFVQLGRFLMVRTALPEKPGAGQTMLADSVKNYILMLGPILIILAAQYLPLYLNGTILFTGPGAALVGFVMNLEHMLVLLLMIIPLYGWLFRLTGRIYPGAVTCALLVAWFFTSTSVIAPIPV